MIPMRSRFALAFLASFGLALHGCRRPAEPDPGGAQASSSTASEATPGASRDAESAEGAARPELPQGFAVEKLGAGAGPAAARGDAVTVNFHGALAADGTEFDSTYATGVP